jgi:hypothetical protein
VWLYAVSHLFSDAVGGRRLNACALLRFALFAHTVDFFFVARKIAPVAEHGRHHGQNAKHRARAEEAEQQQYERTAYLIIEKEAERRFLRVFQREAKKNNKEYGRDDASDDFHGANSLLFSTNATAFSMVPDEPCMDLRQNEIVREKPGRLGCWMAAGPTRAKKNGIQGMPFLFVLHRKRLILP